MKYMKPFIIAIISVFSVVASNAQVDTVSKILGTWTFDKFVFLNPMPDSLNMLEHAKESKVSFVSSTKFLTMDTDGITIDSGAYSIEGKYIIQNGEKAELIELTDTALAVKIPDVMVVYFRREKPLK